MKIMNRNLEKMKIMYMYRCVSGITHHPGMFLPWALLFAPVPGCHSDFGKSILKKLVCKFDTMENILLHCVNIYW